MGFRFVSLGSKVAYTGERVKGHLDTSVLRKLVICPKINLPLK